MDIRNHYKLPPLLHLKPKYSTNFEVIFLMVQTGEIVVFTEELYLLSKLRISCCDIANSLKFCLDYEYL